MMYFFLSFLFFLWMDLTAPSQVEDSLTQKEVVVPGAAPQPLDFSKEKIESFRNDPAFDYTERIEEESWWTTFKRYVNFQWERLMEWLFGEFDAPLALVYFLDVLPYLLLGLLLYFIIYLFLKLNPPGRDLSFGKRPDLILDEDEKIIRFEDIPNLIKKAISEGNYRLAVRYQFLFILQQLTEKNIIHYDASKTDEEYTGEINNEILRAQFQRINRIYDFVWYGDFETDLAGYERIEKDFGKMKSLLGL